MKVGFRWHIAVSITISHCLFFFIDLPRYPTPLGRLHQRWRAGHRLRRTTAFLVIRSHYDAVYDFPFIFTSPDDARTHRWTFGDIQSLEFSHRRASHHTRAWDAAQQ